MSARLRRFRYLVAVAFACAVGSLPSCGTMGGGMRYLAEPPPAAEAVLM